MDGLFEYVGADYKVHKCDNSKDIPSGAKELILFRVEPIPPPHTPEDHAQHRKIKAEFERVYKMIYGDVPCPP